MEIVSRSQAKALGRKRYFDGRACPRGHLSERLVVNYTCIACLRQKYFDKRRAKRKAAAINRAEKRKNAHGGHHLPLSQSEARSRGLKRYYTGVPCPHGHISERQVNGSCLECVRLKIALRDAEAESKRKTVSARVCRARNPEAARAKYNFRRRNNPQFKLASIIRCRIKAAIRKGGAVKNTTALIYLGCSIERARSHIEAQFQPGMSWENHSLHGWHIDHVIPLAAFDLTYEAQRLRAFHYTNLQPLWARDNLSKSKKIVVSVPSQQVAS